MRSVPISSLRGFCLFPCLEGDVFPTLGALLRAWAGFLVFTICKGDFWFLLLRCRQFLSCFFSFCDSPYLTPFFLFRVYVSLVHAMLGGNFTFHRFRQRVYLFRRFLITFLLCLLILFLSFAFPNRYRCLALRLPSAFGLRVVVVVYSFPGVVNEVPWLILSAPGS